jgi:pimeloyl-ACP methyl ester carboxylesterase
MHQEPEIWVLIRGLGRDSRHWQTFLSQFEQHRPNALILACDLPGNGTRFTETSPCNSADYLADLRTQVKKKLKQTKEITEHTDALPALNIIAISFGAMIAMEWLYQHPQEIKHAFLINTSTKPWNKLTDRLSPSAWPSFIRALFQTAYAREAAVLHLTSNKHRNDNALLKQWETWAQVTPLSRANLLRQLVAASRFKAQLPPQTNRPRKTIIVSLGDRLVQPRCSYQIATALGCKLTSHPTAGHDLPLDAPEWLVQEIDSAYEEDDE